MDFMTAALYRGVRASVLSYAETVLKARLWKKGTFGQVNAGL